MNHEQYEDLAPLYALGALDGEDLSLFAAHLPGCDACRKLVREYGEASSAFPYTLASERPAPAVKEAILTAIRRTAAPPAPRFGMAWLAAAAALLLAVGMGYLLHRTEGRLERLARHRERDRAALEKVQAELAFQREAKVAWMKGTPGAPEALASVRWKGREVEFTAKGLPKLDAAKTYELWAIADGKPVRAGEYSVAPDGTLTARATLAFDIKPGTAFAVTVEASGGVDSPTMAAMVLAPG